MFSKVFPGAVSIASFFRDPRTCSLSGSTRNFMKIKWTCGLEMKEICHKKAKKLTKQGSGSVFFLVFNDIGKKGTSKSHSSKQDPVYNEQKDDCCLNQQSLRNPFGNFSQQHFLMEKWNFQNIINTIIQKISDPPKNIVKIPTTFYLSMHDSKNMLSYSI